MTPRPDLLERAVAIIEAQMKVMLAYRTGGRTPEKALDALVGRDAVIADLKAAIAAEQARGEARHCLRCKRIPGPCPGIIAAETKEGG